MLQNDSTPYITVVSRKQNSCLMSHIQRVKGPRRVGVSISLYERTKEIVHGTAACWKAGAFERGDEFFSICLTVVIKQWVYNQMERLV